MAPTITVETKHGVKRINGDELIKFIKYNMYIGNGKKAKCFTFHYENFAPTFYDTSEEVGLAMKPFRKLKKQGIIILRECNLIESQIGKTQIYGFVIQHCDDDQNRLDIITGALGIVVDGYADWFFNTEHRDSMYAWLNK